MLYYVAKCYAILLLKCPRSIIRTRAFLMYNEIHTLSVWSVKKRKRCK